MSRHIEVYHDIYYNMTDNKVIAVTTSNITQLFLINYHTEVEYNYKYLQSFWKLYFCDNYQHVTYYLILSSYCTDQTNNLLL